MRSADVIASREPGRPNFLVVVVAVAVWALAANLYYASH
jgi:hypothetical protein